MLQGEECFRSHCRFLVINGRRENAALNTVLQYRKTLVTLVCVGTVSGVYYTSLDRQSRRKLRATADGLVRFIRYCYDMIRYVCIETSSKADIYRVVYLSLYYG